MITFEWDSHKAASNLKKHGISFEEARSVFFDELAVQFFDEEHSHTEERFLMLGMSTKARLLLVMPLREGSGRHHQNHLSPQGNPGREWFLPGRVTMRDEYDLSRLKSRPNPYASRLKKSVTMRLSEDVIDYFKDMAEETGVPYQTLINLYLRDYVAQQRKIDIAWKAES